MRPQSTHNAHASGFTLVELLVVVAILATLASLIAPVLAQVRNRVHGYTCQNHLRQIGIATALYLQDHDEQYAAPYPAPHHWLPDLHHPYLQQWKLWICPADAQARVWDQRWNSPAFQRRTSYLWNAYIFQGDPTHWRYSIRHAAIPAPATTVLWAEAYANNGWVAEAAPLSAPEPGRAYLHNAYGDNANATPDDPTAAPCPYRHATPLDTVHAGGGNYLFADGHTRWLLPHRFTTRAIEANHGLPVDDRSDPLITSGARHLATLIHCPVLCCPQDIGTPPGDGKHPWFRP